MVFTALCALVLYGGHARPPGSRAEASNQLPMSRSVPCPNCRAEMSLAKPELSRALCPACRWLDDGGATDFRVPPPTAKAACPGWRLEMIPWISV
jgi:hypothetical protein